MKENFFYLLILLLIDYIAFRNVWVKMILECVELIKFRKSSLMVKGVVVDYHATQDLDQNTQYAPIVEYQSNDGEIHILYSDEFKMTKPVKGRFVMVSYGPADPKSGIVNIHSKIRFRLFLFFFMTMILIGINYTTIGSLFFKSANG